MTKPKKKMCNRCGSAIEKQGRFIPYCSPACTLLDRLGPKPADGCWNWQGAKNDKGYGQVTHFLRRYYVHRVMYEVANDTKIPDHLEILHRCDNPACCRPDHLVVGTHLANMHDMISKNRRHPDPNYVRGEIVCTAKLTAGDVAEIRQLYAAGGISQYQLADRYSVRQTQIQRIVTRQSWKHLP